MIKTTEQRQNAAALLAFLTCSDYKGTGEEATNPVHLKIIEQPQEHCRYRYTSEMNKKQGGSHGPLYGIKSKVNRKTYPAVQLLNYDKEAKIRVKLIQTENHFDHPHRLTENDTGMDVYEIVKEKPYIATFHSLKIITTEKNRSLDLVLEKCKIQLERANKTYPTNDIQDDSADMYGIAQSTVSKICKNVAEALAKRAHLFINMPSNIEEQVNTIQEFREIAQFPTVIGAIDCTHIRIKKVSGDMSEAYVNRKGYYSLNVQVVCNAKLKIMDIVARWRGSVHDSRIFNESAIKSRMESGEFHGRLLGDSGYACTPYLFTPLRQPSNDKEEAYNRAHIRTRNTVERCFGVLKQRFRCLLRGMYTKLSTAKTTIVALAVLHNIAIDMNEHIELVRYVRQTGPTRHDTDTTRGAIVRRNFINEHF